MSNKYIQGWNDPYAWEEKKKRIEDEQKRMEQEQIRQSYQRMMQQSNTTASAAMGMGNAIGTGAGTYGQGLYGQQGMGTGYWSNALLPPRSSVKDMPITSSMLNEPEFEAELSAVRNMWNIRWGGQWIRQSQFEPEQSYTRICYRLLKNNLMEEVYLFDVQEYAYKLRANDDKTAQQR